MTSVSPNIWRTLDIKDVNGVRVGIGVRTGWQGGQLVLCYSHLLWQDPRPLDDLRERILWVVLWWKRKWYPV